MGGGGGGSQVIGYKYYLGMHMVFCHGPIDSVTKIEVDDRELWTGNSTGGRVSVDKPELFGGESREGGIQGQIDIEMGRADQPRNDYLQNVLTQVPAFRGVMALVLRQVYLGINPYLKNWAVWGKRTNIQTSGLPQWFPESADINGDMNPAHIIRECLIDVEWGMGYSVIDIDDANFRQVATTLKNENFGLSFLWDRSTTVEDFLGTVLNHIDATLHIDRTTGRYKLALARENYVKSDLLVLNAQDIINVSKFSRSTISELYNSVTVVFHDRTNGEDNAVTVQDVAMTIQQKTTIGKKLEFPGLSNAALASRVAQRELRALSTPLASGSIVVNRKASGLNVGDVFVLEYPKMGISSVVMRVTDVKLGTVTDNKVSLSVVEDIFSIASSTYVTPPTSGWTNPNSAPVPAPYHYFNEATYWDLARYDGDDVATSMDANSNYAVFAAVRPTSDSGTADHYSRYDGTYKKVGTLAFAPSCVLENDVSKESTIFNYASNVDADLIEVGNYAVIGNEFVSILTHNAVSRTLTVGRGVVDTVPRNHLAGARLIFIGQDHVTDGYEYVKNETAYNAATPKTGQGVLPLNNAPKLNHTILARHSLPWPPGNVKLNNLYYPDNVSFSLPLTVTWANRNRLAQTATLNDFKFGSVAIESGVTTRLVIQTKSSLSGYSTVYSQNLGTVTTVTLTLSTLGIPANADMMKISLYAEKGSLKSLYEQEHEVSIFRPAPIVPEGALVFSDTTKTASATISEDGFTFTSTANGAIAMADAGQNSGKLYVEFWSPIAYYTTGTAPEAVGLTPEGVPFTESSTLMGAEDLRIIFRRYGGSSNGAQTYRNGVLQWVTSTRRDEDGWVGIAIDLDAQIYWLNLNGAWVGGRTPKTHPGGWNVLTRANPATKLTPFAKLFTNTTQNPRHQIKIIGYGGQFSNLTETDFDVGGDLEGFQPWPL